MQDPLAVLGEDIFVEVLSNLGVNDLCAVERVNSSWLACTRAHSSGLWRHASMVDGVEPFDLQTCNNLAKNGVWGIDEYDRRPIAFNVYRLLETPATAMRELPEWDWSDVAHDADPMENKGTVDGKRRTRVNWRYVCEAHRSLQNAWSLARCRLRWITPPTNTVWRVKSILEQDFLLCTSRQTHRNGLITVDQHTSRPIFCIEGLDGYAHLEAGRGYVVFNRPGNIDPALGFNVDDDNDNTALEVWRTGEARARSSLPRNGQSPLSATAVSFTHPKVFCPNRPNGPLPRGHLEHYQTLQPPSRCLAFRLHVDKADTPDAKAVVAACGDNAIYIWHLEEDRPMQRIERGWAHLGRPHYIELDDDFVFVCVERQMHIYSRHTSAHLLSFPPTRTPAKETAAFAFSLSLADDFKAVPDDERKRERSSTLMTGVPAPIGRAHVPGYAEGEGGFDEAIARGVAMHGLRVKIDKPEDIEYWFSACHYTSQDLVCTTKTGAIFIIRHYKDVFREAAELPESQRAAHVKKRTMIIGLGTVIRQLTTYRDHIVLCTSFNVILLNGKKLPEIPAEDALDSLEAERPVLRAHVLLGNHPQAMKFSSCVQADARSIYLTYWAGGEVEATGGAHSGHVSHPPSEATEGFGMCVKVWTFGMD